MCTCTAKNWYISFKTFLPTHMYNNNINNLKPRKILQNKICENIISLKCLKKFLLFHRLCISTQGLLFKPVLLRVGQRYFLFLFWIF